MNAPSPSFDAIPRHDWTREELRALFALPFPELVFRAQSVHRMHFDPREVQISTLLSIKTGGCPEDCAYCPQSASYETGVKANKLMDVSAVLADAKAARDAGASRDADRPDVLPDSGGGGGSGHDHGGGGGEGAGEERDERPGRPAR